MKNLKIISLLLMAFTVQSLIAQEQESFYFSKTVDGTFEEVTNKTKALLKEQGFGVITEIDMDAKLKEKLPDIDMKPYKILGVCNPSFAHKTLQIEENIGIFLPCKAIVKDIGNGKIEVVIVNPAALMGMLNKPELVTIANEVSEKFQNALKKL
ncbi:DUF302 domain-containing protein [Carboxylicivirga litoralis]|uniref:DUF302 domain-containing protein n=1 Tax=Carboxylicivirga litoralis TaxID=2816963 RepID=UPI0021CB06D1|nr:DUF302 domain-containing protein [Carboxylicivirga sp. A043]